MQKRCSLPAFAPFRGHGPLREALFPPCKICKLVTLIIPRGTLRERQPFPTSFNGQKAHKAVPQKWFSAY